MRAKLQLFGFFLCVVLSVAGLYNVYSDNAETEALAMSVACGGAKDCGATLTSLVRTPFGQEIELHTKSGRVPITCVRSFYLFGAYSCTRH